MSAKRDAAHARQLLKQLDDHIRAARVPERSMAPIRSTSAALREQLEWLDADARSRRQSNRTQCEKCDARSWVECDCGARSCSACSRDRPMRCVAYEECERLCCPRCAFPCGSCDAFFCGACAGNRSTEGALMSACDNCDTLVCRVCLTECDFCDGLYCEECVRKLERTRPQCTAPTCSTFACSSCTYHLGICAECEQRFCTDDSHLATCRGCARRMCTQCDAAHECTAPGAKRRKEDEVE